MPSMPRPPIQHSECPFDGKFIATGLVLIAIAVAVALCFVR